MTAYPINRSLQLGKSIDIAKALDSGVAMVANPLISTFQLGSVGISSAITGLASLATDPSLTPSEVESIESLSSSVNSLGDQMVNLETHTDTMLFGDSSGSLISGGIASNIGQFTAANNLNDTFNSIGDTLNDTCDLINDFFGSILGIGKSLLNSAIDAVNNLLSLIQQGVQFVLDAINTVLAAINAAISSIINLITSELAAFAKWLANQIDFALGSLFSGGDDNPCLQLVTGAVGTAALGAILAS